MNAPIMFMPVGQDRVVAKLAAAILVDGASASVVAPEGAGKTAVLGRLASELADGQARVVRVACPPVGGLSLPALLSQVIGRADHGVLSNEDLELASDLLTQADTSCSLIALLVDDAHDLLPPALRYIQFACMSGPLLRVVLAGRPGTLEMLRGDEFGYLRQRVNRHVQLPPLSATTGDAPALLEGAPVARAQVAAPPPARRRNGPAWALAGLGIAASVAVAVWLQRHDEPAALLAASVTTESAPALDRLAGPVDMPPSVALAEAPPVTPEPTRPEMTAAAAFAEASPPIPAGAEPAPDPVTPREMAGLLPLPSPDAPPTLVEAVRPAPEPPVAAVDPIPADAAATPREMAILGVQPSSEPATTVVELPVAPPASEQAVADALPAPEPPTADVAVTPAPLDPEPAVADAAPAQEPAAADAVAEPPAVVASPAESPVPEPAVADAAPGPVEPEASAPAVASVPEPSAPSSDAPGAREAGPAPANLPVPPAPVPAPALPVVAMPEAHRRAVARPARVGPERVAAFEVRADERRCRDIVLRAQLGEDITNADRQFLRAGCRAGR